MFIRQDYTLVTYLASEGLAEITVEMKKPQNTSFVELTLEEGDFVEAGHGYYNFKVSKDLLDQLGTYVFRFSGYEVDVFEEKECEMVPLSSAPPPGVCVILGNIRNISSQVDSFEQVKVTIKPLRLPARVAGTFTMGKRVITYSDYSGFFQVPAIQGITVLVEIPDIGIRFQAVIPNQETIRLEDLIPQ